MQQNQKYYDKNKKLKWKRKSCKKYKIVYAEKVISVTADYNRYYTYSASTGRTETVITEKIQHVEGTGEYMTHDASAFNACERSFVYGSGLYNRKCPQETERRIFLSESVMFCVTFFCV